MGYMESMAFFCTTTETVKYRALANLYSRPQPPPHPLEALAADIPQYRISNFPTTYNGQERECAKLSLQIWAASLAHVEVYPDNFIILV